MAETLEMLTSVELVWDWVLDEPKRRLRTILIVVRKGDGALLAVNWCDSIWERGPRLDETERARARKSCEERLRYWFRQKDIDPAVARQPVPVAA